MPRKLKSSALRSDAVTVANIPNGEITAAKLHDTAIQDKLGYVPASAATVASQLATLVDSAPTTLDTLNELAAALGDDANFATTITTALGTKANTSSLGALATLNSVANSNLNDGIVTSAKLAGSGRMTIATAARTSSHGLGGDSGWVDHLSVSFTTGVACRIAMVFCESCTYESGAVTGFGRFLVDGSKVGYNFMLGKQSTANSGAAGSGLWYADVSAGSHTVMVQVRNSAGGTTWYTPYWSVDGEVANTLGVWYYS